MIVCLMILLSPFVFAQVKSSKSSESFGYKELVALIKDKNITSIEELLPMLPSDLLLNPVLMKESQSLQPASYKNPRAILFNEDASMVLTFNGDKSLSKVQGEDNPFYKLEVVEFKKDKAKFEFHEIGFSSPDSKSNVVKFSETNPKKCLNCHRDDPRPNWEHYPFWPGAIGEKHQAGRLDPEELQKNLGEMDEHSRYQYLKYKEIQNLAGDTRYKEKYPETNIEPLHEDINVDFTQKISQHNFTRNSRILTNLEIYPTAKYAIAGILLGCGSADSFMPNRLVQQLELRKSKEKIDSNPAPYGPPTKLKDLFSIFPKEKQHNKVIDDLFMNLNVNNLNEFTTPEFEEEEFFRKLAARDPELDIYDNLHYESEDKRNACKDLISKSKKILTEYSSTAHLCKEKKKKKETLGKLNSDIKKVNDFVEQKIPTPPKALSNCISCHQDTSGSIPEIPFNRPKEMLKILGKKSQSSNRTLLEEIKYRLSDEAKSKDDQMPPFYSIEAEEDKKIRNYLKELKGF